MDFKVRLNILGAVIAFIGMFAAEVWVPFFIAFWLCIIYLIWRLVLWVGSL